MALGNLSRPRHALPVPGSDRLGSSFLTDDYDTAASVEGGVMCPIGRLMPHSRTAVWNPDDTRRSCCLRHVHAGHRMVYEQVLTEAGMAFIVSAITRACAGPISPAASAAAVCGNCGASGSPFSVRSGAS